MILKIELLTKLNIIKENNEMNKTQFNYIAAKLNIKPERLDAVADVIFNGLTATPAESKHGLCRGVIQRDVDRVNDLYNWAIKFNKIVGE